MLITFDLYELKEIFEDVANIAVAAYQRQMRPADDLICQSEAFRQFQEVRVRRWRDDGLITARRSGPARNSKIQYSRTELLQVDAAEKARPIFNRKGREGNPLIIFRPKQKHT